MSAASSSNSGTIITDLCTALEYPLSIKAQDIPLSKALKSIFHSESDDESKVDMQLSTEEQEKRQERIILKRFDEARKLYQLITTAESPPDFACFYKLAEIKKLKRFLTTSNAIASGSALPNSGQGRFGDYLAAQEQGKVYDPKKQHN